MPDHQHRFNMGCPAAYHSRDEFHGIEIPAIRGAPPTPYLMAPILLGHVGYFETELVLRTPFVPAWGPGLTTLVAEPGPGGLAFKANGSQVGRMNWWLANWQPFRAPGAPAGTACSTYVDIALADQFVEALASPLRYACSLAVRRRDTEYGAWTKQINYLFMD